jgi:hypothetical protein
LFTDFRGFQAREIVEKNGSSCTPDNRLSTTVNRQPSTVNRESWKASAGSRPFPVALGPFAAGTKKQLSSSGAFDRERVEKGWRRIFFGGRINFSEALKTLFPSPV